MGNTNRVPIAISQGEAAVLQDAIDRVNGNNHKTTHRQKRLRRQHVADAIREGMDCQQACDKFGISSATVLNACRENGVILPKLYKQTAKCSSFAILKKMLDNQASGNDQTDEEIAAEFSITRQRIGQIRRAAIGGGFDLIARKPGRKLGWKKPPEFVT